MDVDQDLFSDENSNTAVNDTTAQQILGSSNIESKQCLVQKITDSGLIFSYSFQNVINLNKNVESSEIYLRELPWRILITPNQSGGESILGVFLQCNADSLSKTWSIQAKADIMLLPKDPAEKPLKKSICHLFNYKENDWGFRDFIKTNDINKFGYLHEDGSITIQIYVKADVPHGVEWDSKKHTGCVGLMNQGATCYMNSLLQTIFFTNEFRRTIYCIPTECDTIDKSVALALQRVFYELQFNNKPVDTKLLTKSFGWNSMDSFMQHDVQEFLRVLLDKIETKMRGSNLDGTIQKLFQGKMSSYVRCKNVPYSSTREETFYDIQLNIKDCSNIYESFKNYVACENLEGDNRYYAGDDHGFQDAEKGVIFTHLPPVLHLHLMRFQYDPITDSSIKNNERFEFYEEIDLSEFLTKPTQERPQTSEYILHGVLVHSGDNNGGHYVVYIKVKNVWLKFDDDVVSQVQKDDAMEQNYGVNNSSNDEYTNNTKSTNAYMLCYIKKSDISTILKEVSENDIPDELQTKLQEDYRIENSRKTQDSIGKVEIKIILEDEFEIHNERSLLSVENCTSKLFIMTLNETIEDLLQVIEKSFFIKRNRFKLWLMFSSNDQIIRLKNIDDTSEILENIRNKYSNVYFLEIANASTSEVLNFDPKNDLLVFYKFYDPTKQILIYLGHSYISLLNPNLFNSIHQTAQKFLESNCPLNVYDESTAILQPDTIYEKLMKWSKISKGIIIIFEYKLVDQNSYKLPTYLDYIVDLTSRKDIMFVDNLDTRNSFKLNLSEKTSLRDCLDRVASFLKVDSKKIKFFSNNSESNCYLSSMSDTIDMDSSLKDLLNTKLRSPKRVYYQVFPVNVQDLKSKLQVKINFLKYGGIDEIEVLLLPNKTDNIQQFTFEAKKNIFPESAEKSEKVDIKLVKIQHHRITQIVKDCVALTDLDFEQNTYRLDEVPTIEVSSSFFIPIFHFNCTDRKHPFGSPFLIRAYYGQTARSILESIRKHLTINEKEWSNKYKIFRISFIDMNTTVIPLPHNCEQIVDGNWFNNNVNTNFLMYDFIGLEHSNMKTRKSKDLVSDKSIKIYN